jgi:hypothetical protein
MSDRELYAAVEGLSHHVNMGSAAIIMRELLDRVVSLEDQLEREADHRCEHSE